MLLLLLLAVGAIASLIFTRRSSAQSLLVFPPVDNAAMHDSFAAEDLERSLLVAHARGHTQRATASARSSEPPGGGDPGLADDLLVKWSYGKRSAVEVNENATLARRAGAVGGYLRELAELGSNGRHLQNCSRDLIDFVRKLLGAAILPMYVALVPMFVARTDEGGASPQKRRPSVHAGCGRPPLGQTGLSHPRPPRP